MKHLYSLAHLSAISLPPVDLIEVAARTGYDYVGLRLTRVTDTEPLYPIMASSTAMQAAKAALAAAAADIAAKFEPQATDPATEAKPEIWTNWDDFVAKADALKVAAEAMDASSLDSVKAGMGAIGGSCKACHSVYRM